MTTEPDDAEPQRPPVDSLRQLFGSYDDEPVEEEIPTVTYWPDISADAGAVEWVDLRSWVKELQERFSHLDHHVIPNCWWRHNEHVEALVALRDHERSSFSNTAPATAPLDWFRALRDITALLRTWTAERSCGAVHQNPPSRLHPDDTDAWDTFVAADVESRRRLARLDGSAISNALAEDRQ